MYERVLTSKAELLPEIAPWESIDGEDTTKDQFLAVTVHVAAAALTVVAFLAFIQMWSV